jgi:hypothetical protein
MTQPFPTPSTPRGKRSQGDDYQVVPPQQSYTPMPPPPLGPVKARKWPWIVAIVVAFLFGIGVGGAGDKTTATTAAGSAVTTQTVTVAAPVPQQQAQPAVIEAPAAPAGPAASGPKTSFGDGTWVVGEDIAPRHLQVGRSQGRHVRVLLGDDPGR